VKKIEEQQRESKKLATETVCFERGLPGKRRGSTVCGKKKDGDVPPDQQKTTKR